MSTEVHLTLICIKWVPGDPSTIFLATSFTQRMPEISVSMYPSILMLGDIWNYHFTLSGPNLQEIVNLFQFSSGPRGPTIGTKFTISCEFYPLQVKWWCHMFSNIWVKVVVKNILLGSLETQHQAVFALWCLFLKKRTNFLYQTVTLSVFLVKHYTSLIYMKEKSFCLVNWAFPFVCPRTLFMQ